VFASLANLIKDEEIVKSVVPEPLSSLRIIDKVVRLVQEAAMHAVTERSHLAINRFS
jgi:hypothetical protein